MTVVLYIALFGALGASRATSSPAGSTTWSSAEWSPSRR